MISPLLHTIRRSGGRNQSGSITVRHRGGGRRLRQLSLLRQRQAGPAVVVEIPSDSSMILSLPNRIVAAVPLPIGVRLGSTLSTLMQPLYTSIGSSAPLFNFPPGSSVHNIEPPSGGGPAVRSAGGVARLLRHYRNPLSPRRGYSLLRLPSGELRLFHSKQTFATAGVLSGGRKRNLRLRKAGESRNLGVRPSVRGIAMNPIDHPNGGGQGKTSGVGRSPWGLYSKGTRTRTRPNRFVVSTVLLLCALHGNPTPPHFGRLLLPCRREL